MEKIEKNGEKYVEQVPLSEIQQKEPIAEIVETQQQIQEQISDIKEQIAQIPPVVEEPQKEKRGFAMPKKLRNGALATLFTISSLFGAKSAHAGGIEEGKKETATARKVATVPEGYTLEGTKDGKTYYIKTTSKSIEVAKPGSKSDKEDPAKYNAWIKAQLAQGISPEELAEKKFISKAEIPGFSKFYVANTDRVYIEPETKKPEIKTPEVKADPYSAWGGRHDAIYGPDGHIVAEMWYPTVESSDKNDGGVLNTSKETALLRFKNDFGFTGREIVIAPQEYTSGTNTIRSQKTIDELTARATKNQAEEKIETLAKNK